MLDLLIEHVGHQVGRGPHPLADLGPTGKAAGDADIDVPVLVRLDPALCLHLALANHRPGCHRRVDLVAGAVQKAGVDEGHSRLGGSNALGKVQGRSALFVHDADLHGVRGEAENLLDPTEDLVGEGDLLRTVHLRLDDVDRSATVGRQARHRAEHGDHRVEQTFVHRFAIAIEHGRCGHEMSDVADQHHSTATPGQLRPIGSGEGTVCSEATSEGLSRSWSPPPSACPSRGRASCDRRAPCRRCRPRRSSPRSP